MLLGVVVDRLLLYVCWGCAGGVLGVCCVTVIIQKTHLSNIYLHGFLARMSSLFFKKLSAFACVCTMLFIQCHPSFKYSIPFFVVVLSLPIRIAFV